MKLAKMPDLTRTPIRRTKTSWVSVRRQLKVSFAEKGIVTCELKYENCWRGNNLSFAHALKRRHLVEGAEEGKAESIYTVILACVPCHQKIEVMGESTMKSIVMHIIASRAVQFCDCQDFDGGTIGGDCPRHGITGSREINENEP